MVGPRPSFTGWILPTEGHPSRVIDVTCSEDPLTIRKFNLIDRDRTVEAFYGLLNVLIKVNSGLLDVFLAWRKKSFLSFYRGGVFQYPRPT